jgi:hypothetical protein
VSIKKLRFIFKIKLCRGSALVSVQIQAQLFNLDADPDPVSQTNADPVPVSSQTLPSQKAEVLHEMYFLTFVGSRSLNKPA